MLNDDKLIDNNTKCGINNTKCGINNTKCGISEKEKRWFEGWWTGGPRQSLVGYTPVKLPQRTKCNIDHFMSASLAHN